MSTLKFPRFPVEAAPPDYPEESLLLRQFHPTSASSDCKITTHIITDIIEVLSYNDGGMRRVYRASIRDESTKESTIVVCKIAMGRSYFNNLKREAEVYKRHLSKLQGTVVPQVFGFFTGHSFDGKTCILVMQDCGVRLRVPHSDYPLSFRKSLVDGLVALHRTARVKHCNLDDESHIVVRQLPTGKLHATILSFREATVGHMCDFKGSVVPLMDPDEVPCSELREIVHSSEIYGRATVQYRGHFVPAKYALTPKTLIEQTGIPNGLTAEQALVEANKVCAEYRSWLECRAQLDSSEESFNL